ncbi:hypothetical protein RSAG8_12794, partial [Rhizoctonia solani AG-8 WAC10335]
MRPGPSSSLTRSLNGSLRPRCYLFTNGYPAHAEHANQDMKNMVLNPEAIKQDLRGLNHWISQLDTDTKTRFELYCDRKKHTPAEENRIRTVMQMPRKLPTFIYLAGHTETQKIATEYWSTTETRHGGRKPVIIVTSRGNRVTSFTLLLRRQKKARCRSVALGPFSLRPFVISIRGKNVHCRLSQSNFRTTSIRYYRNTLNKRPRILRCTPRGKLMIHISSQLWGFAYQTLVSMPITIRGVTASHTIHGGSGFARRFVVGCELRWCGVVATCGVMRVDPKHFKKALIRC